MNTGILSVLMHQLPYQFSALGILSTIVSTRRSQGHGRADALPDVCLCADAVRRYHSPSDHPPYPFPQIRVPADVFGRRASMLVGLRRHCAAHAHGASRADRFDCEMGIPRLQCGGLRALVDRHRHHAHMCHGRLHLAGEDEAHGGPHADGGYLHTCCWDYDRRIDWRTSVYLLQ